MGKYSNEEKAEIFRDTINRINADTTLNEAVKQSVSGQKYYTSAEKIERDHTEYDSKCKIEVSRLRSFEAARKYANGKDKVCVLNFASAVNPGGGVKYGAPAQEEGLCRVSTLYPALSVPEMLEKYYHKNKAELESGAMDNTYCDDCIYTPGVVVIKEDGEKCALLPESERYTVDVITCAAPDLRMKNNKKGYRQDSEIISNIFERRIERIFEAAASKKADVLILGAFGCGAFGNSPVVVSEAFSKAVEKYSHCFKKIEFAVYCRDDMTNFNVFKEMFETGEKARQNVVGFHDENKEYGFMSNWYKSDFTFKGQKFSSMEQYMMYMKALEFGDEAAADEIMNTSDQRNIKEIGRKVKKFDELIWDGKKQIIIYEGLMQKFLQNPELADLLIATGDAVLAECAVHDKVWGIGLDDHDDSRFYPEKWRGKNLLGFALMMVREKLSEQK